MNKQRRDFIIKSGVSVLGVLFSRAIAMDSKLLPKQEDLLQEVTHETVTFEHFYKLSSWVTYQNDLDEDVARYMFEVIKDEPWGDGHTAVVYNKLGRKIAEEQRVVDVAELIKTDYFEHGESWFISHIVMTWYLGIYYHNERETKLITYEGALMRKMAGEHVPIPYYGRTPYGEWSEPPKKFE